MRTHRLFLNMPRLARLRERLHCASEIRGVYEKFGCTCPLFESDLHCQMTDALANADGLLAPNQRHVRKTTDYHYGKSQALSQWFRANTAGSAVSSSGYEDEVHESSTQDHNRAGEVFEGSDAISYFSSGCMWQRDDRDPVWIVNNQVYQHGVVIGDLLLKRTRTYAGTSFASVTWKPVEKSDSPLYGSFAEDRIIFNKQGKTRLQNAITYVRRELYEFLPGQWRRGNDFFYIHQKQRKEHDEKPAYQADQVDTEDWLADSYLEMLDVATDWKRLDVCKSPSDYLKGAGVLLIRHELQSASIEIGDAPATYLYGILESGRRGDFLLIGIGSTPLESTVIKKNVPFRETSCMDQFHSCSYVANQRPEKPTRETYSMTWARQPSSELSIRAKCSKPEVSPYDGLIRYDPRTGLRLEFASFHWTRIFVDNSDTASFASTASNFYSNCPEDGDIDRMESSGVSDDDVGEMGPPDPSQEYELQRLHIDAWSSHLGATPLENARRYLQRFHSKDDIRHFNTLTVSGTDAATALAMLCPLPRPVSSGALFKDKDLNLYGLENRGNTCYANAALQVIFTAVLETGDKGLEEYVLKQMSSDLPFLQVLRKESPHMWQEFRMHDAAELIPYFFRCLPPKKLPEGWGFQQEETIRTGPIGEELRNQVRQVWKQVHEAGSSRSVADDSPDAPKKAPSTADIEWRVSAETSRTCAVVL